MAGYSIAHKPLPLHRSRWDKMNVTRDGFYRFSLLFLSVIRCFKKGAGQHSAVHFLLPEKRQRLAAPSLQGGLATAERPIALLSTARGSEPKPPLFDVPLVFADMWIRAKSGRGRARPPAVSHGAQQQQQAAGPQVAAVLRPGRPSANMVIRPDQKGGDRVPPP